jgi:4-amino-4-deoxy-L-arabinose transferase-like glycosyltransferase
MKARYYLFGHVHPRCLLFVALLTVPALYVNLGLLPLNNDESIRALVSHEMIISGDYITPTLNGELYFNKPPLFNWILIFFFRVFQNHSEFVCRFPTTLSLIFFSLTVYLWARRHLGNQLGILSSLMFLTCGRNLFYDSFHGLIDITFSWIVFINFIVMWHYHQKKNYQLLFLFTYILTAVSFLLKGLPSLAFQGITLLTLFTYTHNFRKLISLKHLLGIVIFLAIVSLYYYLYYLQHPDDIMILLGKIISESTEKTALGVRFGNTLKHVFAFPFELIYHFLPWTLFAVLLLNKQILKRAFTNSFIRYCVLVFLFNLIIYWLSPITYPRYLIMLLPLTFIVFIYLAKYHVLANTPNYKVIYKLVIFIIVTLAIVNLLLPVAYSKHLPVNHIFLKTMFILLAEMIPVYILFFSNRKTGTIFILVIMLLISRISFNIFVLPYRQSTSWLTFCRKDAIKVSHATMGHELFVMADTLTVPNSYYITREREEILKFSDTPEEGSYYLIFDEALMGCNFRKEFSMRTTLSEDTLFYAGRFFGITD